MKDCHHHPEEGEAKKLAKGRGIPKSKMRELIDQK